MISAEHPCLHPTILAWPQLEQSGNTKLAWCWLWCKAAHREGMIVSSAAAIADALGASDRVARRILQNLEAIGALQILERNVSGKGRLRGQLRIYVRNPNTVPKSQPPGIDPHRQQALIPEAVNPRIIPAHPAVSAPKPPAVLSPELPDTPPDLSGQVEAAQRFAYRGGRSDPAVLSPKPPRSFNVTKEKEALRFTTDQRTARCNDIEGADPLDGSLAAGVTEAFQTASDWMDAAHPTQQKCRLRERILKAAAVVDRRWWVAGAGADLVVTYGVPHVEVEELLSELVRRRHLPNEDPKHIRNAPGWLQTALARVARRVGMTWGCRRDRTPPQVS